MSLTEQVYNRARLMAQELTEENQALLESVCAACVTSLKQKLRENIGPEDCLTEFVTAAAMLAVAAMWEIGALSQVEQFTAGDISLRKTDSGTSAQHLRQQAQMLMQPYWKAGYVFVGV